MQRDWGHARFCRGNVENHTTTKPDDFILATSKTYSVKDFVELAFSFVDIKIEWSGSGLKE